jgi:putative spermidine/putrescine transport system permease protein
MTASAEALAPTGETVSLGVKLRRAERRHKLRALGLVAPVLAFMVFVFVIPMASVLYYSVSSPEVLTIMPRVAAAMAEWDGAELPGEETYAALAADLQEAYKAKTLAKAALRLNYELRGFRTLAMRSARRAKRLEAPYKEGLIAIDARWGDLDHWHVIKSASSRFTAHYLLAALDLDLQWDGSVKPATDERKVYIENLERTFWISFVVLVWCALLGYPIAYLIANSSPRWSRIFLIMVLLPFWTSLLVRTAAWVILLQRHGIINDTLLWLHVVEEPLELIFNRFGVYVAMVHILLPFMVLPLYAVMKGIPPDHMRAAASLGARPLSAFIKVYLPQSVPGLAAGCMLVFVIALGFYITPTLVGGGSDQMLSYLIALFSIRTANWGMAGALAVLLLLCVAALYPIYHRFAGGAGGLKVA